MKREITKNMVAKILKSFAMYSLVLAANIQCAYIFHQPEKPDSVKKYRKF